MLSRSVQQQIAQDAKDDIDMEEEEEEEVHTIDTLQDYGINQGDIKKLKAAEYFHVADIVMHPFKEIIKIKGISEAKAESLVEAARKITPGGTFRSCGDLLREQSKDFRLQTGSKAIDEMLGGGIPQGMITQIYGAAGSGKTQICSTLCCTAQLPVEEGGADGKVFYVDTEGSFKCHRLKSIAERYSLDAEGVLENISYIYAATTDNLENAPWRMAAVMQQDPTYKLIIVDSFIASFRREYHGRGELSERQVRMNKIIDKFNKLGRTHKMAVVFTNQIMSDPGNMFNPNATKPVGGNILQHGCHVICEIKKKKACCAFKLVKASDLDSNKEPCNFVITAGGGRGRVLNESPHTQQ